MREAVTRIAAGSTRRALPVRAQRRRINFWTGFGWRTVVSRSSRRPRIAIDNFHSSDYIPIVLFARGASRERLEAGQGAAPARCVSQTHVREAGGHRPGSLRGSATGWLDACRRTRRNPRDGEQGRSHLHRKHGPPAKNRRGGAPHGDARDAGRFRIRHADRDKDHLRASQARRRPSPLRGGTSAPLGPSGLRERGCVANQDCSLNVLVLSQVVG
jgi:hypothetical protein